MRSATLAALVVGLAVGLAPADANPPMYPAGQINPMPAHWMNPHPPFVIHNCYWHPGPYGIWGPTDVGYPYPQPVRHIGPPPFGPRWWYQRPVVPAGYDGGPGGCEGGMCGAPAYGAAPPPDAAYGAAPPYGNAAPGAQPPSNLSGRPQVHGAGARTGAQPPPGGPGAPAGGAPEGKWFRSPRDFFMYPY